MAESAESASSGVATLTPESSDVHTEKIGNTSNEPPMEQAGTSHEEPHTQAPATPTVSESTAIQPQDSASGPPESEKTPEEPQVSTSPTDGVLDIPPGSSHEANQGQTIRKKRGHSEWLEKALEEGGASKRRSRTSKRISDPDFVFTDQIHARDKSATPTTETSTPNAQKATDSLSTAGEGEDSLPDLDYANMTQYEKFYKYKKEYKEWKRRKCDNRKNKKTSTVAPVHSTRQSPRVQKKWEQTSASNDSNQTEENEQKIQINLENLVVLQKDKFCWHCHKEVVETPEKPNVDEKRCEACWKIFHVRCDPNLTDGECKGELWECKHCIEYRNLKENDLWAPYVEYLGYDKYIKQVRYIIDKLKKYPSAKEFLQPVNAEQFPDYRQYIAHPVDFEQIERRLKAGEYRSVDTLFEDFKWIFHNSVIFNGNYSAITKDLRVLLRYLRMDLYDLDSCACCYIHAYTRPEAWFILPCPSPHLLVWAQLKGFPYWPAKVYDSHVEQRQGEILVKFFGDHARSWIPFESIYLYSLDPPSTCPSRKKKKHSMIPSLVEMDKHIELLKKQFGVFKYPEQDILIGTNTSERSLQLKYMLPSCTTTLPKKPCTIERASRLPYSNKEENKLDSVDEKDPSESASGKSENTQKPHIEESNIITTGNVESEKDTKSTTRRSARCDKKPEPTIMDLNDASSKRSILSRLEERMQQCRSDSEDGSVKSFGKKSSSVKSFGKESSSGKSFGKESSSGKSFGKEIIRTKSFKKNSSSVKSFGKNSSRVKSFKKDSFGKECLGRASESSYRNNSKAARSVRCQMFFKVLERKMRKVERGVKKRKIRSSVSEGCSGAKSPEKHLEPILENATVCAETREENVTPETVQDGELTTEKENQLTEQEKAKESENSNDIVMENVTSETVEDGELTTDKENQLTEQEKAKESENSNDIVMENVTSETVQDGELTTDKENQLTEQEKAKESENSNDIVMENVTSETVQDGELTTDKENQLTEQEKAKESENSNDIDMENVTSETVQDGELTTDKENQLTEQEKAKESENSNDIVMENVTSETVQDGELTTDKETQLTEQEKAKESENSNDIDMENVTSETVEDGELNTDKETQLTEQEKAKESENSNDKDIDHDNAVNNASAATPTKSLKKPSCDDIDQFIETHLASSQQTAEWDESKIPPILSREKETETSEEISEESRDNVTDAENASYLSTPSKVLNEIVDKVTSETVLETEHLDEIVDEHSNANSEMKVGDADKGVKKLVRNVPRKKSLRFRMRLFRHKTYTAQLFDLRKLTHEMKKHSQKQSSEPKPLVADFSKYFHSRDVTIAMPSVTLTSLTIEEMKELKRNVKLSKNKGLSGMNVGGRSKSTDSEFVPIEDTMRISMDSEDLNAFSCDSMDYIIIEPVAKTQSPSSRKDFGSVIDQVAKGDLASRLDYEKLNAKKAFQKKFNFKAPRKRSAKTNGTSSSSSSFDRRRSSFESEDPAQEEHHRAWESNMAALMKCLADTPGFTTKKSENMLHDVMVLKRMTEETVGQAVLNQVSIDTQYSAALNAAELVLYSEYASAYNPPDLAEDDFDVEYPDDSSLLLSI